jgi:peptide/nickel transport system substrate-binding protein
MNISRPVERSDGTVFAKIQERKQPVPTSDYNRPESVFLPHLINRRSLLAGLSAVSSVAAMVMRAGGQQATPAGDSGTPSVATPGASPIGSPIASPIASDATPIAPPGPEMIGNLLVVRDQSPYYDTSPNRGGMITMARVGRTNLDYNPASFAQDFQIPASYLEPLVWIDGVTMEPQPWLATEWEWNKDRTEIEYKLRDDVRWHDDEAFTARDVEFSFTVYRDDIYSDAYNLFTSMASIKAVDDTTVRVRLSAPDGNWIRNASSQLIFQREQYGQFWDDQPEGQRTLSGFNWNEKAPVGTAQWIVNGFRDSRVDFKRNRQYWNDNWSWASELRIDFVNDQATQLTRWHDGNADIVWPIAARDLPSVSDRAGTVYAAETTTTMFAAFNFNNPVRSDPTVFSDIRIRQALSLGIDRGRYARDHFASFFRPEIPGTIIQPDLLLSGVSNPIYAPDEARHLLEEAGFAITRDDGLLRYPDGSALKFDVIVRRGDNPDLEAILNSVATDLRAVGVILEVRPLSPERFEGVWISDHTFDMIAFAYSLYPGFTDFDLYGSDWDIRSNIQGFNPGGYHNEKVERAITRALVAQSDEDYVSALHAIQRQVNDEDLFALWFGSPLDAVLVQDDISGYQPNKVWQGWETSRIWRD